MTPEGQTVEWATVAEGDQLWSVKTKKFYPVLESKQLPGGAQRILVDLGGGKKATIDRPTPAEPRARVVRGPTGRAVDMFRVVFSGEVKR